MSDEPKPLSGGFKPDPERYRKASEPHASPEAAVEALNAFVDEVAELRVKYRVTNLLLVYTAGMINVDGTEQHAMGSGGFGNQAAWEGMAAFAYGKEKTLREQRIRELLTHSGT